MSKDNNIPSQYAHESILEGVGLKCCFCDEEVQDKAFCIEHNNKLLCLECVTNIDKVLAEEYRKNNIKDEEIN